MILVCYVSCKDTWSKDHAIMKRSYPLSQHLAKFVGHRPCDSGYKIVLVCHVTSQDHTIKRSYDFMGKSHSKLATTLQSLVAIATVVVKIKWF